VTEDLDTHLREVVAQLKQGKVIPFLGAGANLANRSEGATWDPYDRHFLPSGGELARHLIELHDYLPISDQDDLVRVAQTIAITVGSGPLYETLRQLFDADYPPTPLHELLARLPRLLRDKGWVPLQLVVTTNYDDLLERAFREAGEEVDVVTYMALGPEQGMFLHFPPDGEPLLIEKGSANEYPGLPLDDRAHLVRPVILKVHGAVDRLGQDRDSFVITEDDYIEYLIQDISGLVPATLKAKLEQSNFLFLGYSLRDWNLRAILHRIWTSQRARFRSWAVQHEPDDLDRQSWQERGVRIMDVRLDEYVPRLDDLLEQLPARTASPNA
jgi:hypothetical protein